MKLYQKPSFTPECEAMVDKACNTFPASWHLLTPDTDIATHEQREALLVVMLEWAFRHGVEAAEARKTP